MTDYCDPALHGHKMVEAEYIVEPIGGTTTEDDDNNGAFACCERHLQHAMDEVSQGETRAISVRRTNGD